ncbi:MAG: fatty-acid--CoA ligase, partial [Mycobacteriaceae bacterium]|nr:fatty-acid--CoA ligase [Mycobacteriaceae bacterium]
GSHSLVLASDYRVPDVSRVKPALERWRPNLASIGAHHVVMYTSNTDVGRVLVTIGIRQKQPLRELLRSRTIFEWFDDAGLEDIPAVFAGEIVEKVTIADQQPERQIAPTVVAAMSSVDNVAALLDEIHSGRDTLNGAGVRKIWVYQALDNDCELMLMHEFDDEDPARRWIAHPALADRMSRTGSGAYPPPFVGSVTHLMTIETAG